MTDNEIIKALEECTKHTECEACHFMDECYDLDVLHRKALDLINRQKAEIERLEGEIDNQYEQAKADILGNMADGGTSCHWCIEQHKAEAVKEFAEKVSQTICDNTYPDFNKDGKAVNVWDAVNGYRAIDNLLKETVGDAE